jgi:hypothetical protein
MPADPGAGARAAAMTWEAVAAGRQRFDTACHKTPAAPPTPHTLLRVTLVLFGALTAAALRQHGDWGIFGPHWIRLWIVLTLPAGSSGPPP